MLSISIQDLKKNGTLALSDIEPTYLIKHSKVDHVILPKALFEELIEAQEDLEDLQAIYARRDEPTAPLEDVEKALGLATSNKPNVSSRTKAQRPKGITKTPKANR